MNYREVFRLCPRHGSFDVEFVRQHLAGLLYAAERKDWRTGFILGENPEHLEVARRSLSKWGKYPDSLSAVTLSPTEIEVWNAADEFTIRHAQAFVQWMLDHYDVTITDEDSVDVTAIANGDAANLYPKNENEW